MIEVESRGDVAWLRMLHPSGNAMHLGFLQDLGTALDKARDAKALVLTGQGASFSVGLDLPALLGLSRDGLRELIVSFSSVMERVFLWPRPTVAALNGHAVAGGFILSAACDFRVLQSGPAKMGMTGVSLGIAYPALVTSVLQYVLPQQQWHAVMLEGRLFTTEEALQAGLVDRTTSALDEAAQTLAVKLGSADPRAYERTKLTLKQPRLVPESPDAFVESLFHPGTRERLEAGVAKLKKASRSE